MTGKENEAGNLLPMTVTEGISVNLLPHEQYEYLMTTKEVARGYGVTQYAILKNKFSLQSELVEGKHYVTAITIGNSSTMKVPHNAILWTKRGIVRLGFAMRSARAKLFRDWAEDLVIERLNTQPAIPAVIDPVDKLMELALESNELSVRKQLYQNYLELRNYTESLKKEVAEYKVNHDKWSNFVHKKTKDYQSQKGGQA